MPEQKPNSFGPEPDGKVDSDVVARMARGDRDALSDLYRSHAATLHRLALRMLRDEAEAGDLVHDVFLEAWRLADQYDSARGSVKAWLLLRTRSRALDRLRSPSRSRSMGLEDSEPRQRAAEPPKDDAHRLPEVLLQVSELEREVLCLGYFEGLNSSEIAQRLGVPVGTVKSRTRTALQKIRDLWKGEP